MEGQHKGDGKWLDDWKQGGFIEKAERWQDFVDRVTSGLNIALKGNGPVLIVAHGGVYWAIQEILQLHSEGDIPNCQPVFHQPHNPLGTWLAEEIQNNLL
jgi:broad specificity phosphatase PhoE